MAKEGEIEEDGRERSKKCHGCVAEVFATHGDDDSQMLSYEVSFCRRRALSFFGARWHDCFSLIIDYGGQLFFFLY